MVKTVYWTITEQCTFGGNEVVFLRFGHTEEEDVLTRINKWKNYCPLSLTPPGSIPSVNSIDGQPDDAIRSRLINLGFNLSQPDTVIDWFVLPVVQPNGDTVTALVQAAFNLAGVNLTANNINNVTARMGATMNR